MADSAAAEVDGRASVGSRAGRWSLLWPGGAAVLLALTGIIGCWSVARVPIGDLPAVRSLQVKALYFDDTPVDIVTTAAWLKVPATVTMREIVSDPTTWLRLHLEDWDRLAPSLRQRALSNMLRHFGAWISDPAAWSHLRATDWDHVPQPVRALAILGMVDAWAARYRLGEAHGLDRALVADTAKAIAMTESWFEHRAVHVNADGSHDVGISGASAYAREALSRLHRQGLADFTLSEADYLDPLPATRVLVFWLDRMLAEAGGDLDLAIRAYNVGISRARRGAGADYLRMVRQRRSVYIWRRGDTPTWEHLLAEAGVRAQVPDVSSLASARRAGSLVPSPDQWVDDNADPAVGPAVLLAPMP